MVTNSICSCYLKWIFRWPKRIFLFLFIFVWALCDTDVSEVKWWKMPRFSVLIVARAYTSFRNSRICHRNSMEKHAKCSSCKLIYGHARQQCKSIHQSSRTYLFKWVRRNETWITLDKLCSTSIWIKRTLFLLLLLPMLNFERIRFELTRFQLIVDNFLLRWPDIFFIEFLSIWDNFFTNSHRYLSIDIKMLVIWTMLFD